MSIFSKGTRSNVVRLKSNYTWGDEVANPFTNTSFGNFCVENTLVGLGPVTRLLVSFPTLYMNHIKEGYRRNAGMFSSSVATELYNMADKYRFYRISGFKIKLYPKYPVTCIPLATTMGAAPSIAGTTVQLDVPVGTARHTTAMKSVPTIVAGNNAGFAPVYDPASRRSIGFCAGFLNYSGIPFSSLTDNDLLKYLNSNFKRIVFKGGYQSIYYKCYRNTGDTINGQIDGNTYSNQILIGWRPTDYNADGFRVYDEQGVGILFPFSYRDLTTRYQITITTYFKFLYEKGLRVSNND